MKPITEAHFAVRQSGAVGLEIVSPRGKVVAWTVDPDVARIIASQLNEIVAFSRDFGDGDE
jgi:hypothetical protein